MKTILGYVSYAVLGFLFYLFVSWGLIQIINSFTTPEEISAVGAMWDETSAGNGM